VEQRTPTQLRGAACWRADDCCGGRRGGSRQSAARRCTMGLSTRTRKTRRATGCPRAGNRPDDGRTKTRSRVAVPDGTALPTAVESPQSAARRCTMGLSADILNSLRMSSPVSRLFRPGRDHSGVGECECYTRGWQSLSSLSLPVKLLHTPVAGVS
jgi:hypothetical protein